MKSIISYYYALKFLVKIFIKNQMPNDKNHKLWWIDTME